MPAAQARVRHTPARSAALQIPEDDFVVVAGDFAASTIAG